MIGVCVIISLLIGFSFAMYSKQVQMDNIRKSAMDLASAAALLVDGDSVYSIKTEDDSLYQEASAWGRTPAATMRVPSPKQKVSHCRRT
jgi:uncharacterized protein YpmB